MNITINGKKVSCQPGELLLDIAERNSINIPRLCHHDAFPGKGCCRVCITEVKEGDKSKMVTACIYPVDKECEVFTDNEKVTKEREMILSFLKKLAPESPEIKGLCKYYKVDDSYDLPVEADEGRCIICGLCVDACNALGTGAISTVMRGTEKKISTPYDDASKDCIGCGSCVNVCPTGAIEMDDDTADKKRSIWKREFELQYCTGCGALMGTREAVDYAAKKAGVKTPEFCEECRQKQLNSVLAETFGW